MEAYPARLPIVTSHAHYPESCDAKSPAPALPQHPFQSLAEEKFAPHHGFIDAQPLVDVIDAALENPLPLRIRLRQVLFAQRSQNLHSGHPVEMTFEGIRLQTAQTKKTGGRDGGRRCIEQRPVLGGSIEVPRRNAVRRRMR